MNKKQKKKRLKKWSLEKLEKLSEQEFLEVFAVAVEDRSQLQTGDLTIENRLQKGAPRESHDLLMYEAERRRIPLQKLAEIIVAKAKSGESFLSNLIAPTEWRRYEIHASHAFITLFKKEGIQPDHVLFDARLRDLITGKPRQFDFFIASDNPKHGVAFEFKNYMNVITIAMVEAFVTKIRDTGVNKGIIVTAKGYHSTALQKAKHYGIGVFRFRELTIKKLKEIFPDDQTTGNDDDDVWLLENLDNGDRWTFSGELTDKPLKK